MTTIPMSKHHCELIRQGKKTTTLRSLKYDYDLGQILDLPDGTKIKITDFSAVGVHKDRCRHPFFQNISSDDIAKSEGYNSWSEVVAALKKMRHKLPKDMWLYTFEVVSDEGS